MEKNINKNLGEIPIHQFLQQLSLKDLLWDFDAVSIAYIQLQWVMKTVFIQEEKLVMPLQKIWMMNSLKKLRKGILHK